MAMTRCSALSLHPGPIPTVRPRLVARSPQTQEAPQTQEPPTRESPPAQSPKPLLGGWGRPVTAALRELALLAVLYLVYRTGRLLVAAHVTTALNNAVLIHHWEAWLRLPSEALIQTHLTSETLLRAANVYYVSVHFPVMIAFLLLGYFTRPGPEYRWARNLIIVQTSLALLIDIGFPLAPPRMFPQWGFMDTMSVYGPSAYDGAAAEVANQFAAMPSLHVGWAVAIAYVVTRTGPRWLVVPAWIHALVTVAVVIVTANHWWLDGLVAIVLLGLALVLFPRPAYRSRSTQPQEVQTQEAEAVQVVSV
jgi:hypothetical protein